jgi:hypothetical protein
MLVGITERGDAGLDLSWQNWKGPKILITKAPQNLLSVDLENAIVHCTITGWGGTKIEPNVQPKEVTLAAYETLVSKLGGKRVVLRVDPIFPTEKGLARALEVISRSKGRVRVSFIDAYQHVRERFAQKQMTFPWDGVHAPLELRKELLSKLGNVEVCGEPGLACAGCISQLDLDALGINWPLDTERKGQRAACMCFAGKKELLTHKGQCENNCLYCYWK